MLLFYFRIEAPGRTYPIENEDNNLFRRKSKESIRKNEFYEEMQIDKLFYLLFIFIVIFKIIICILTYIQIYAYVRFVLLILDI